MSGTCCGQTRGVASQRVNRHKFPEQVPCALRRVAMETDTTHDASHVNLTTAFCRAHCLNSHEKHGVWRPISRLGWVDPGADPGAHKNTDFPSVSELNLDMRSWYGKPREGLRPGRRTT